MNINKETKNREPEVVTIKLTGSLALLELVLDKLEEQFYAVRTSLLLPSSDKGYHIYLKIVGARK